MGASRFAIQAALVILSASWGTAVHARWTAQMISHRRLAQISVLSHYGELPALMSLERGGVKDGSRMPIRVGEADMMMSNKTKNVPQSGYFMLTLSGKGPPKIGEQFQLQVNELQMMTLGAVMRQSGELMCAGKPWVVAESSDGSAFAVQPDSLERLALAPPKPSPVWGRLAVIRTSAEELVIALADGSLIVRCVGAHVSSAPVINVVNKLPAFVLALGDARSDGRVRYYAVSGTQKTLVEGRLDSTGAFHPITTMQLEGVGAITHIAVGDARGEGRDRLYVAGPRGLLELTWDRKTFHQERIDGEERVGAFSEFTNGLLIGLFRDDGKKRIYLANGNVLSEYSFSRNKWSRIEYRPLDQRIYALETIPWIRPSQRLVLLGEDSGAYTMKWQDDGWTAVAPFVGPQGVSPEGEAVAELVRHHLLDLGNCRILEREKLSALLAEHKIQMSRLIDPKTTVQAGKLIGAGQVIVGRVESIFGDTVVSAKSVDVESGTISRQQFINAQTISELKARIPEFSFGICTGRSQ